jgi:alginate O-acetyltransferase complex protein AlgI
MWHGANWTFLVWGALRGAYYVAGRVSERARDYLLAPLRLRRLPFWSAVQVVTVFHLVVLAWVFFRAPDIGAAVDILRKILVGVPPMVLHLLRDCVRLRVAGTWEYWNELMHVGPGDLEIIWNRGTQLIIGAVFVLELVDFLRDRPAVTAAFASAPRPIRWLSYYAVAVTIVILAPFGAKQFIYFQF